MSIFISYIAAVSSKHLAKQCQFEDNEYRCSNLQPSLRKEINLPPNACMVHACKSCIKAVKSFVLNKHFELTEPMNYVLQRLNSSVIQITHITNEEILINPLRIDITTCYFEKRDEHHSLHRRLMDNENAEFNTGNLSMHFEDPVLQLSEEGKVIIQNEDFNGVFNINKEKQITIPFELLQFRSTLTVIFISKQGHLLQGEIHVSGKSICQERHCIICANFFFTIKCLPRPIQYGLYFLLFFSIILLLWCAKVIVKMFIYLFKTVFYACFHLFKICKFIARFSLITGSYLGIATQNLFISLYQFLENYGHNAANVSMKHVLIAILLCIITPPTNGECNANMIIKSDLRTCEKHADGVQTCKLFSTAEITLPAIKSESCIWFTDKQGNHLFTIKISLEAVTCEFSTQRLYFTFPVKAKHLSQVSCIFNEYCGRGIHCVPPTMREGGLRFEAETPESRDFPGISGCMAGGIGTGCSILTRAACNFFRTWYEPDLLHSYEVSKILGHTCKYHISVKHIENNTISHISVLNSAYTDTGIKVTILGAFDQPQIHLSESLIQRVGKEQEAYLTQVSDLNNPTAGQIGAIQANQSYTKSFNFDSKISTCDFFEDRLRCTTVRDPLLDLKQTQKYALPLERDLHLFKIKDGRLISSLLVSSAVKLQLHFHDYNIHSHTITVCPKFQDSNVTVYGCYDCAILARMTFTAHSTCQAGIVMVSFQQINTHTKALHLSTEPHSLTIKFSGDVHCYKEKLCLTSHNIMQCKQLDFCLEEPSIELLHLNTNYTTQISTPTTSKFWEWIHIPSINSSLFFLKFVGSTLFIVCICITICSTLITCCCRR